MLIFLPRAMHGVLKLPRWSMTVTLLNFSQRLELELHAKLIADVQAVAVELNVPTMLAGAFARDRHALYAHGIDPARQTEDIDIALVVENWDAFRDFKQHLIRTGCFSEVPSARQRLRHRSDLPVDLVPFGGVETETRQVDWPPGGEFRMNVFGFQEAYSASLPVRLPGPVDAQVVSLPALALLKIVAWQERHYDQPGKDAADLALIARNYLAMGNEKRMWEEFLSWTEENNFDADRAGARMLGVDIAALLDEAGRERIAAIIAGQADTDSPGVLPREMLPYDAERARVLLESILEGLFERP
jgi:predicted nucleotidyltransferase